MSRSIRGAACAFGLLGAGLAAPSVSLAAVPALPPVPYSFAPSGQLAAVDRPISVAQDGSEVLFVLRSDANDENTATLYARNLTAKTTSQVLPTGALPVSASANDQRVLYLTSKPLDVADHNTLLDFYVLDRKTGASTLVSRSITGAAIGQPAYPNPFTAALSGDGNTVVYDGEGTNATPQVMRYVLATGKVSVVGPGTLLSTTLGTSGSVVMTSDGLVTPSATIQIPFAAPPDRPYRHVFRTFKISPDGSAMVEDRRSDAGVEIFVTNTATGAQRQLASPPFSPGFPASVLSIADTSAGAGVLLASPIVDPATTTSTTDELQRLGAAGTFTPVARVAHQQQLADVGTVMSADSAYLAGANLYKLGTSTGSGPVPTPIPAGVAPNPGPTDADAVGSVKIYPGCSAANIFAPLVRPSVVLNRTSPGIRQPVSATVRVVLDSTARVAGTFTVTGSVRHSLTYGFGGYWLMIAATFSDGTTASGLRHIATYTPVKNDTIPFSSTKGVCKTMNGL